MVKKIALIDSYAFFYKAHYAFERNPLISSKGENTSVIFSFISSLLQIAKEHQPDIICCALDSKGKTIRHEIDPNYKANRPPMPDDLKQQIEALIKIIPLLGVPCLSADRYEADDIIAQMAREMQQHNDAQLLIYSSDKDLMQLVGKNVFTMAGDRQNRLWTKMDAQKVEEKYGVPPEKIVDYLALIGDKSDNIPGVMGIGKVTASKLLKTYNSLEGIYQNIEKISGSVKKKLQDGHDAAFFSRKLIVLDHELNGIASFEKLKMGAIDKAEIEKWLTHYECTALLKKISPKHSLLEQTEEQDLFAVEKPPVYPFEFVRKDLKSIGDVDEMVAVLQEQPHFTFDLETTSLDALSAQIIAISFAFSKNKKNYSFYVHYKLAVYS